MERQDWHSVEYNRPVPVNDGNWDEAVRKTQEAKENS